MRKFFLFVITLLIFVLLHEMIIAPKVAVNNLKTFGAIGKQLTILDTETNEFSAYRFHDQDPVFFQNGFRLTNRVGETVGGSIVGEPPRTRYTTYVWLYQW